MTGNIFNSDSPITKLDEDNLGRKEFAINLGNRIIDYDSANNENLVIGIAGEWGSGKSSLMNMVLNHIESEYVYSEKVKQNDKPIIMRFNPWRFSNQDQLISQFFNEMNLLLGGTDYANIKNVARKIELYASFFEPVGIALPPFGLIIRSLKRYLGSLQEFADNRLNDFDSVREDLDKALKEQNHKIIIALDDIDRLNVDEIHIIFQLIKILANFPNTMYLIGFDRGVVSAALDNNEKNLSGSDYLEKIIQVIFEIPHITEHEMKELVKENLENEFGRFKNDDDIYHFDQLYDSLLKYKFKNIRNLNRYINTLKLTFEPIKDDVFYVDFYVFTAVHVFFPELYQFIKKNKELLLFYYPYLDIRPTREEFKDQMDQSIVNLSISGILNDDIKKFLIELFPNLKRIYQNWDNRNESPQWRFDKMICDSRYFDTYFKFTVPTWEFSKKQFNEIIFSKKSTMVDQVNRLAQTLQTKLISDLKFAINNEPKKFDLKTRENLILCLLEVGDTLRYESNLFSSPIYDIIELIRILIEPFDSSTTYNLLKIGIKDSKSLYTICKVSYDLFIKPDTEKEESEIKVNLEKSHVTKLKSLLIKKIENTLDFKNLYELNGPFYILLIWKELGCEKELNEYIKNASIENIYVLLKILTKNDNLNKFTISDAIDSLTKLIDLETLNNKLKKIVSSNKLHKEDLYLFESFNEVISKKMKPKSFVNSLKKI
jgi:predicted KAP-like P-loop ATPase